MRTLSLAYYRAVARAVGVPDFWMDDAVQDIALALWRDGAESVTACRREAIDCARRYGRYTRYGNLRAVTVSLDEARDVTVVDEYDDWRRQLSEIVGQLTGKQRQALSRRMAGLPMTSLDSAHASAARRRIRTALAA